MITYKEAKGRVFYYRLLGYLLLSTSAIVATCFYAKALNALLSNCPSAFDGLCRTLQSPIVWIYRYIPGIPWLWEWTPELKRGSLISFLYSPAIVLAIFFFFFSAHLLRTAAELKRDIVLADKELRRQTIFNTHVENVQTTRQSIGGINAGGDVHVVQTIGDRVDQWHQRPLGIVVLLIVGGTLAAILAQAINVWLGLAH